MQLISLRISLSLSLQIPFQSKPAYHCHCCFVLRFCVFLVPPISFPSCSCGKVIDLDKEFTHGLHCKHILQPLYHVCHTDLCHTVGGFIKHAHKDCVIGTEVEVIRDAAQGPSVVTHCPLENLLSCMSISSFRKSLVRCPIISM